MAISKMLVFVLALCCLALGVSPHCLAGQDQPKKRVLLLSEMIRELEQDSRLAVAFRFAQPSEFELMKKEVDGIDTTHANKVIIVMTTTYSWITTDILKDHFGEPDSIQREGLSNIDASTPKNSPAGEFWWYGPFGFGYLNNRLWTIKHRSLAERSGGRSEKKSSGKDGHQSK